MRRVGIFGWGVVAPRSPNIDAFYTNLDKGTSWLSSFNGFGPDNFLVGTPDFDFERYKSWIDARFPPNRYRQLAEKMDPTTLHAVGAFIQSLEQNPGIEQELQRLGTKAHIYIGCGVGNIPTIQKCSLDLYRAQRAWNRFWGDPIRNSALKAFQASNEEALRNADGIPSDPESVVAAERDEAEEKWYEYWTEQSPELQDFLKALAEIDGMNVQGDVETGKRRLIKEKQRRKSRLLNNWGAPAPPWERVSPNIIWNIANTPASQVSMLGKITGLSFASIAACSTFGVCLKLAIDTIRRGEAKAVVIGATDPPPHPLIVGAFYGARVLSADRDVSKPLTGLRGTHVSGGSVLWIVGDYEHMTEQGYRPVGMEPLTVGVSSDADHIITPSKEGPLTAIHQAIDDAEIAPDAIATWDLHATATPGDFLEMENLLEIVPESVLITARKGIFGHGMSAGGGWELTAQYLGYEHGKMLPIPLQKVELNEEIARLHSHFVFDNHCEPTTGIAGKMSMGVGGVNACVLSRPLQKK